MILQIIEPMKGGHHSYYITALLPSVNMLLDAGLITEVVLTVTKAHWEMLSHVLPPARSRFRLDLNLLQISPAPSLWDRQALFRSSREAVKHVSPDAVLCTSADYDILPNSIHNFMLGRAEQMPARCSGIFHYGYPAGERLTPNEKVKRLLYESAWRGARYDELLMVNPVVYEDLVRFVPSLGRRAKLLPDPVSRPSGLSKEEARNRLRIEPSGRYIGFIGMMDHRKAIPELAEAFTDPRVSGEARLLLAGRMDPHYRSRIGTKHQGLIESGRIVIIDRELTDEEIFYGYAALDIPAILQYRRFNLSANVLKAVSFGKVVVVDTHGHAAMIARKFGAGFTCDVRSKESICKALINALEYTERYSPPECITRLIEYHHPTNYARVALASACGPEVERILGKALTWSWVCEGQTANPLRDRTE